jgi:hypothetical protein
MGISLLSSPSSEPTDSMSSPHVELSTDQCGDPDAENPVVPCPETDNRTPKRSQPTKQQYNTYCVEFEMKNCGNGAGNGAQFLLEFRNALIKMEQDASILLPNSNSEDQKIDATTNFHDKEGKDPSITLKAFVSKYIGGLTITKNKESMKGKIRVRTRCKFAALKQNQHVRKFLQGEWSGRDNDSRVVLLEHLLDCNTRHVAGLFLNTDTRYDLVSSFSQRIGSWFETWKGSTSNDVPQYQVDVHTMYRGQYPANYYRLLTAKKDVTTVAKAMSTIFPEPSATMSFVSSTTWECLPSDRKSYYHNMHLQFQRLHSSFLLRGVKDSSVEIAMDLKSDERISVFQWMKSLTLSGESTEPLFTIIEPHLPSGNVEMLSTTANEAEAKKWLSVALVEIGQRANASDFEEIFQKPESVRNKLKSLEDPIKPTATTRAFQAKIGSGKARSAHASAQGEDLALNAYLAYDTSQELLIPGNKKRIGNKKTAGENYRGQKKSKLVFHLVAAAPGEPSSHDAPSLGGPSKKKPPKKQKKKKKDQAVNPQNESSSQEKLASLPIAPSKTVSVVAEKAMDSGEDDDSTTTSVMSNRSYASVAGPEVSSSVTLPTPTAVDKATDIPSSVTVSRELSSIRSENAALKRENAALKKQLRPQPRVPQEVRPTAKSEISDHSQCPWPPLPSSIPEPEDGFTTVVKSPPRKVRRSTPAATVPTPTTTAMVISHHDLSTSVSKRSRSTTPHRIASLPASTDEETEDMVTIAATQVSNLTLTNIPRSQASESGMQL